MLNHQQQLSEITQVILEEPINYGKLYPAIQDLKTLFLNASEVDVEGDDYKKDIHHSTGKAIGTQWAALCVDDLLRTKRFISGACKAIQSVLKKKKEKPVTLLYVGTGPFATLVMPLTTVFKPEELQLILVEINPISLESVKNCIVNFGAQAYVKEILSADAAQLQLENPNDIDILLLECLQFALVKEQQVAITYNLVPQLRSDVIMVPEEIKLSVCVVDSKKKMEYLTSTSSPEKDYCKMLQPIFVLNKQEILKNNDLLSQELHFTETTTPLTEEDKANNNMVAIATEICVFDTEKLDIDQCSLTMMHKISDTNKMNGVKAITTQYLISEEPGWKITYVD